MIISVLGLGDAGSAISSVLADAGLTVRGFDIRRTSVPGIDICSRMESAVVDADYILSATSSTVATKILKDSLPFLKKDAVYVDLNTTPPGLKRQLSQIMNQSHFVDGAIMKPIDARATDLPIIVAGQAANAFAEVMSSYGLHIEAVGEKVGDAATRALIANIFTKGITSVVIDALWAAEALGLEEWAIEEFRKEFEQSSAGTLQSYLDRAQRHAKREQVAVSDIVSMLNEAGYESLMTAPTELVLSQIIHSKKVPFSQNEDQ